MLLKVILYFILTLGFLGCYNGDKTLTPHIFEENVKVEESYSLEVNPKVDILFIIDDSASMKSAQVALAKNIGLFTQAMELNKYLDYNIGVISTSYGSGYPYHSGKLQGSTPFITKETNNGLGILESNVLNLGLQGNGSEKVFDPVQASIDPSLNLNPGFLRSDAFFVLIIITDAHDQGQVVSGFKLYNNLVNLKANDIDRVLAYGVLAYPDLFHDDCPQDDLDPNNILDFMMLFSNANNSRVGNDLRSKKDFRSESVQDQYFNLRNIFSLCDPKFGEKIAKIGDDIRLRVSQKIPLPFKPVDGSIVLKYGTELKSQIVDKRWWKYDFVSNSIILDPRVDLVSDQKDSRLFVTLDKADLDTEIGNPEQK